MYVYADHAATTEMSEVAKNSMIQALKDEWGNPSSLHSGGQRAKEALEAARAQIAGLLGAQSSEIYFTSGGSEADNQAILTGVRLGARKGKKHIFPFDVFLNKVIIEYNRNQALEGILKR